MTMKICRDCKQEKQESEFIKNKAFKSGLDTLCILCNRKRVVFWRSLGKRNSAKESRLYYKKYPHKCVARCAKYQKAKLKRAPLWLSDKQNNIIELFYNLSSFLTQRTGIRYEVDHIVPIQGKSVSGLHVPWNLQVITKEENVRKSNRY